MKRRDVGGQAVIEGVMMRGSKSLATAVRTPKGNIEIDYKDNRPITKKHPILNIPFLRGFFVLIDSMKVGMESLNYSEITLEKVGSKNYEVYSLRENMENPNVQGFDKEKIFIVAKSFNENGVINHF